LDWFGFQTIICSKTTVDCYNPKCLSSSMGSIFRMNIFYLEDFQEFVEENSEHTLIATAEGQTITQLNLENWKYFLLGNEAQGISEHLRTLDAIHKVAITGAGRTESLNVAISLGIFAFRIFEGKQK